MPSRFAAAASVQTQKSATVTVAAPIGGWNARDALGAMDPLDAVTLTNFWPGTNSVILRSGYTKYATNLPTKVESLMVYTGPSSSKMFAASGTAFYDVSNGGSISSTSLTGLTNARWQYVNITTTGGSYLLAVNGVDKQRVWDGSAWHKDGDGAPYDVTGVDTSTCSNIQLFKNRIWLIQANTLKAWYLPINSIGGAAASLDMSSIARRGGTLVAAMTWTLDAGYGMDDMLAFITTKGDVMVWRLTDPTTPAGISLVGVYELGSPIGKRCFVKYGGDLLIITQDGVVPMSGALQSSRLDPRVSITNKIQFAMSAAISTYGSNFGWQLLPYPKENMLFLNVPVVEGEQQQQYVQNNITQAWCNFTGWQANCWCIFNDDPYFGGNTYVGKAWNGEIDDVNAINAYGLQSFQVYGNALQKQCKMIRYHVTANGIPTIYGNVNVDYDTADSSAVLGVQFPSYGIWDSGNWDFSFWGADQVPIADWQGVTGIGSSFAPVLKAATNGVSLQWIATDMVFESGGTL